MSARREKFWEDGYLVVDDIVASEDCEAFCQRVTSVVSSVADEYLAGKREELDFWPLFHRSLQEVSVMWDGWYLGEITRELARRAPRSHSWESYVARVGGIHFDEEMKRFVRATPIVKVMREMVDDPVLVGAAMIYKQPGSPVQFHFHQDSSYLASEPDTMVNALVALDDMNEQNGGISVVPASHNNGLNLAVINERGLVPVGEQHSPPKADEAILAEMKRGSVLLLQGRTWHCSGPNRSDKMRRGLLIFGMSQRSRMTETSWCQPPAEGFQLF